MTEEIMNFDDYLKEMIEEMASTAVEYGSDPSPRTEIAFSHASEILYKAAERSVLFSKTGIDRKIKFMLKGVV